MTKLAKGFIPIFGLSLDVSIDSEDWGFSIYRIDRQSKGDFYDLHEKEVFSSSIRKYLPNLESLKWENVPNIPMMSYSESYAKDLEFEVKISASDKSKKTHQEVIEAFMSFMSE